MSSTRMFHLALILGSLALASALAGCQHPHRPPPGGLQDPIEHELYPKIVIEEPLRRFLRVNYDAIVVEDRAEESPLQVTTPVRSMADTQMRIQYRYRWMDDAGRIIQDTNWIMDVVEPRLSTQLSSNATRSDATDWRLEIRSAR